jgi:hypothetical protein
MKVTVDLRTGQESEASLCYYQHYHRSRCLSQVDWTGQRLCYSWIMPVVGLKPPYVPMDAVFANTRS